MVRESMRTLAKLFRGDGPGCALSVDAYEQSGGDARIQGAAGNDEEWNQKFDELKETEAGKLFHEGSYLCGIVDELAWRRSGVAGAPSVPCLSLYVCRELFSIGLGERPGAGSRKRRLNHDNFLQNLYGMVQSQRAVSLEQWEQYLLK